MRFSDLLWIKNFADGLSLTGVVLEKKRRHDKGNRRRRGEQFEKARQRTGAGRKIFFPGRKFLRKMGGADPGIQGIFHQRPRNINEKEVQNLQPGF